MSILQPSTVQNLDDTSADWHPAKIKAELNMAGYSMASLAEQEGLNSGSSLSKALTGSAPAAELRLATAIGVHPKVIWPSRYNDDGSHKPQGARRLESSRRSRRAVEKANSDRPASPESSN